VNSDLGRRVLVTGASSGIGAAVAERFAGRGARLALIARGEQGLERVAGRARALGAEAHTARADVSNREGLGRAVAAASEALGGLDVAVVNAGVAAFGPFRDVTPEDFDRVIDVTLRGAVDTVRLVLPHIERSGGVIVITGSTASKVPIPLMSSYVAAKHALRGFAGALRMELQAQGSPARVAMVHPGPVDTPFWKNARRPAGITSVPAYGSYSPETVARAIVAVAASPRRELAVGGAMLAWEAAYGLARPALDPLVGRLAQRLAHDGADPGHDGALQKAGGEGVVHGGLHGRPSLWAEARTAPARLRHRSRG
jgi:short-subunit dehydrogenase